MASLAGAPKVFYFGWRILLNQCQGRGSLNLRAVNRIRYFGTPCPHPPAMLIVTYHLPDRSVSGI